MKYQSYIEELQNLSNPLELNHIVWWIMKYEDEFYKALPISNCKKWHKWFYKDEKPFPCCCSIKEKDCLFIEFYHNLKNLFEEEEPDLFYVNNIIKRTLNNFKEYETNSIFIINRT